jgi:hypothetical protein
MTKPTKSQPKIIVNNRSAASGRFVTERYAKTHPATTVTERNKVAAKPTER